MVMSTNGELVCYNQAVKKAKRVHKAEKVALTGVMILDEEGLLSTKEGLVALLKGMAGEYVYYAHLPFYGYYASMSKRRLTVMVNALVREGLLLEKEIKGNIFLTLSEEGKSETLEYLHPRKEKRASQQIIRKGDL